MICEENRRRYGTDIGRIGPMLLADRYDDRTHFIFELLQNAEDALSRRGAWNGPRRVTFELTETALTISHFGKPFDEADVRGVCGIAESTKDSFSIGRFGIGFKSVYTFTDRPEIHSGSEEFAVEDYVQPTKVPGRARATDETLIVLPLKTGDVTAQADITKGFQYLGPSALLFLRHIDEINWKVDGGASGVYLRSKPEPMGASVEQITVFGEESGQPVIDQTWLVFNRDVFSSKQEKVGRVEVAFSLSAITDASRSWSVQPVATSPLVVFFPTVVSTNLGFLVQGPYRTTPSRDNIPRGDAWNQHLVKETAALVVEAMRWLRDKTMLDISALRCLPLEREKFPEGSMFAPVFEAVKQGFTKEALLPRFDGGYVSASQAKLARTQDLRELFSPTQVGMLFDSELSSWLSGDITQDRAPEIRQYLLRELGITEITPATLVPRFTLSFLEVQSDEWILRLYEFLSGQEAALRRRLDTIPVIRLRDGSHVVARENGKPKAFLPSKIETDFPTMRSAVCATAEVRSFLISLGISEPDPVDDVIWNVLPKYRLDDVDVDNDHYAADIERIRTAFATDSKIQRDKLVSELREASFVMVIDTGDGEGYVAKPGDTYIATDRLKQLYSDVPDVFIVDDTYDCLRGENMRELLEACGALRYPRPIEVSDKLTWEERRALREQAGHEATSNINDRVIDWSLRGFDDLIEVLPALSREESVARARSIWESLGDLEERRGRGIFEGTYSWTHHGSYKKDFPAAFVRHLNSASWIPNEEGVLQQPSLIVFETLGWKPNPFLLSKIAFKPQILDELARAAGIDPETLDLLKRLGITSVAELTSRLGITQMPPPSEAEIDVPEAGDIYDDAKDLYGDDMPDLPAGTPDPEGGDVPTWTGQGGGGSNGSSGGHVGGGVGRSNGNGAGLAQSNGWGGAGIGSNGPKGSKSIGSGGGRPFISYIGSHPNEENTDPDGLDHCARMEIEKRALDLIIELEPTLRRAPAGNPGFDLYEADNAGITIRWVEVKSMTGGLEDRPVALSRPQFELAQQRGTAYWLYVVEHTTDPTKANVLRIRDPFGHARYFTFDHGWGNIAQDIEGGQDSVLPEILQGS
jgi:hypothetical protein